MNKIYKLVWSKTKNCLVPVSEITKNNRKSRNSGIFGVINGTRVFMTATMLMANSTSPWMQKPVEAATVLSNPE